MHEKDLTEVGFASNAFDIVYMRDVFEHVLNPRSLLIEINRILRKDGTLCIIVPNIEGAIYKLVRKNHVVVFGFAHVNYWSPKTLRRILDQTGFRVLDINHRTDDFRVSQLAAHFLGQLPFTSVRRRKIGLANRLFLSGISVVTRRTFIKHMDDLLPRLANLRKRGSVLRIIAKKE